MICDYELLDEDHYGSQLIKLTVGDYRGIIYSYSKVKLVEEDDLLRVQFNYELHECDQELDKDKFKDYIGGILVDILEQQLIKNEVVFTGGVDENRTADSEQSDT